VHFVGLYCIIILQCMVQKTFKKLVFCLKSISLASNEKLQMKCVQVICKIMAVFWLCLFADYKLNCMSVEFVCSCR
jgi:hypothetical protein